MPDQADTIVTHTPGPWYWENGYVKDDENDDLIAEILSYSCRLADLNLIAAAPELLATAKDLLEQIDSTPFGKGGIELLALQKAIARAEGRS